MNPIDIREQTREQLERTFQIAHLGCANCAAKMERQISQLSGVDAVSVNFATASVHVKFSEASSQDKLIDQIASLIRDIEPDACLIRPADEPSLPVLLPDQPARDAFSGDAPAHPVSLPVEGQPTRFIDGILATIHGIREVVPQEKKWRLLVGTGVFAATILARQLVKLAPAAELLLFVLAYGLLGADVLRAAVRRIGLSQLFDENFLMAIATIGAFFIGEYPEAVSVMLFYQAGEVLQDVTVDRSRKALGALVNLRPDIARIVTDAGIVETQPERVTPGQIILIRPGDRVPLDCTIIEGRSSLDTAALTGESLPREAAPGDALLAGFVNGSGLLTAQVTRNYAESAVSRILKQTEEAQSRKAPAEKFITRFAAIYTPAMVVLAALIAFVPPLLMGQSLREWSYRALILLVISCPCALVLSIPLGYFGGIGAASARGILVKGGHYLEKLASVDQIVFDKTGTLTEGRLAIEAITPEAGVDADELLALAAFTESHSDHPIAHAVREAAQALLKPDEWQADGQQTEGYQDRPGLGIIVQKNRQKIACGNARLMAEEGILLKDTRPEQTGLLLYLAVDGALKGSLVLSDRAREDAHESLRTLKDMGVRQTAILSGDRQNNVSTLALLLGIDQAYGDLLPGDKVRHLENIMSEKAGKGSTVYIGDGINDAPVLARADVGIAFGRSGTDAAIESADVVILSDQMSKLSESIRIARKTSRIIIQNVVMALGFKGLVMLLSLLGMGSIWQAVFADVGVALLAVLNSLRVIRH